LKRLDFLETFQDGPKALEKGWVSSTNERYSSSEWVVVSSVEQSSGAEPRQSAFSDEESLVVNVKHKHYGLTHVLAEPFDNTGKTLVFQYEVRFHEAVTCSGAYAKLLLKQDNFDAKNLEEASPYVIMFGPDKCGGTNKVHFIVRQKLPNGKWEEKHMSKSVQAVTPDSRSHLYTLIIRPDNSFQVLVDKKEQASGSLLAASDFSPAFGAPSEIDDPTDSKPADWVDLETIADPDAVKPADWDEEAPKTIPDPDAVQPEDWSEEDDGEWRAPDIANPEYKGKWNAPIIPNPAYKGVWKPRRIPNPEHFVDEHPSNLAPIGAIAFEILANDRGIAFDNIVLTHDEKAADEFAQLTFVRKAALEQEFDEAAKKKQDKEERLKALEDGSVLGMLQFASGEIMEFVMTNIIPVAASVAVLLMTCVYWCCFTSPSSSGLGQTTDREEEEEEESEDAAKFSPPSPAAKKSAADPKVEEKNED